MKDATPRMKALLAGGATILVFGIIVPANATDGAQQGKPADGSVGQARFHDLPPGQGTNDGNSGYKCDGNSGAGKGNPAFGACDGSGGDSGGGDWTGTPDT